MKYNPAEAAVAWYGDGSFHVRDRAGNLLYSIQLSDREADAEMTALKATGLFHGCGTYKMVINPQNTGHIYYGGEQLKFESPTRQNFMAWNMASADAEKLLASLPTDSPVWTRVPGKMGCLNANSLSAVKLRGDEIDFYDIDGKVCETSSAVGADIAAPLIARAKAAIDAWKSIKAPAPATSAAATATPAVKPTKEERLKLKDLFNTLKSAVFGQDEPLSALARAVKRARAGLQEENKPMGSFLFLGPTGVGKTEAARQLAKALGYDFKKFDMSEYVSKWDASRLVGGSPNYVGYEEGGQLTNFVREHPKCVLLFDEIEKAHPEVANLLLQVLDDAQLTDGKGKTVFFKDTVIILTSNLGTTFIKKGPMGFAPVQAEEPASDEARTSTEVKSFFLAEFVNRLTDVIRFKPLNPEVMLQMVDKFVAELTGRVKKQDTDLTVTPAARKLMAEEGFSEEFGARPLKRVLEKASDPLADEILFGSLENGGTAVIDAEPDAGGQMKLAHRFNSLASNDNKVSSEPASAAVLARQASPKAVPA